MNGQQRPQYPYPEATRQPYLPVPPPPPPPPPPQAPLSPLLPPRIPNRRKQVLILAALAILLVGGGIFSYFWYLIPPEKVIQAMLKKTVEAEEKSLEYTGQVSFETTDTIPFFAGKMSVDFSGALDLRDEDNPKESLSLNMGETKVEIIGIGEVAYFKVKDLPDFITGFLGDSSGLENQWIKVDPKEIREEFGLLEEELKKLEGEELTPEEQDKIEEAFLRSKIIKVTEKLPAEKVEKTRTHHYKFSVDKDELIKLSREIDKITGEDFLLTEDEIESFKEELKIGGELWIGKRDFRLYKIALNFEFKEKEESRSSATLGLSMQFNHNKPVKIRVPSSAKPFKEVLNDLGGENALDFGGPEDYGGDGNYIEDSDGDGLDNDLEELYKTDPDNPDTDGDGYPDGEEVDNGFNPKGSGRL